MPDRKSVEGTGTWSKEFEKKYPKAKTSIKKTAASSGKAVTLTE
jgi:hypothetical protein